jgi:transaldolase
MDAKMQALKEIGQSVWLDFIQRSLLTNGEFRRLVEEDGVTGVTANPTIFQKAIAESDDYDEQVREVLRAEPNISTIALYERLAIDDIHMALDTLRPVYEASGGADGFVSLELAPELAYNTEGSIADARRLWKTVDRPNLLLKIPATPQGIPAIEECIAEGININITLMFSTAHYEAVAQAYIKGIQRNPNPNKVASVASFFVSRVDTAVDPSLEAIGTPEALALRGKVAVANTKLVYQRYREIFYSDEFETLRKRGAKVQRPLWGSTGTKNPAYSDVLYVDELIGPDVVNTVPLATLKAFKDHGRVRPTLLEGLDKAKAIIARLPEFGIDLDEVTEKLQVDGVAAFAASFDQLLASLEETRRAIAVR